MSLVEILIGITVFTTVFIPAYGVFVQSRGAVFKSKLAMIATLAAQEEAEDYRLLARLAGADIQNSFRHDWESVATHKNAMGRLSDDTLYPLTKDKQVPKELEYPDIYERIWTKLEVHDTTDGFVYPATLHVRWQEKGERFTPQDVKSKEGFSRFEFYMLRPTRGI